MNCYKITADTRQKPKVVFTQTELSFERAKLMATILSGAFRSVDILNEITGEVELQIYTSSEFFSPVYSIAEAFKKIGV